MSAGQAPPDPMISATGLSKRYRIGAHTVQALDAVDLQIHAGEFVSLVGPSGAGKSTLLHVLGALDTADSGAVLFAGHDINGLAERQRAALRLRHIGFVFQFFNLLPTMSAWENVALPKLLSGQSLRAARPDAVRLLDRVGLADRASHRPAELSGGQIQRVAIARALITDPDLVLADEPTGNLDSAGGAEVISMLVEIAHDPARPRSVVMVTHDEQAAVSTDRIIRMKDGAIVGEVRTAADDTAAPAGR